jgi:hypothetical protein
MKSPNKNVSIQTCCHRKNLPAYSIIVVDYFPPWLPCQLVYSYRKESQSSVDDPRPFRVNPKKPWELTHCKKKVVKQWPLRPIFFFAQQTNLWCTWCVAYVLRKSWVVLEVSTWRGVERATGVPRSRSVMDRISADWNTRASLLFKNWTSLYFK